MHGDGARTAAAKAGTTAGDAESVESFQSELSWRDFYVQVLAANPETVNRNFETFERPIEGHDDPDEFAAWKPGETGYPIVDHGERREAAIEAFEAARGDG